MEPKKGFEKGTGLTLFAPSGLKDLRQYHPELKEHFPMGEVTATELRFVWNYVMIYGSEKDRKVRALKSLVASFGSRVDVATRDRYASGDFPDNVRKAIEKMESFDPAPRLTARYITEKTFLSYQKIIDVDVEKAFEVVTTTKEGDTVKEMDWTKLAQYVSATTKINESLPSLINSIEEGYGYGKSNMRFDDDDNNIMEDYMNQQR